MAEDIASTSGAFQPEALDAATSRHDDLESALDPLASAKGIMSQKGVLLDRLGRFRQVGNATVAALVSASEVRAIGYCMPMHLIAGIYA